MIDSPNKLLAALENERRYVARKLHDGVAQTTLQLSLEVGICRKLLERNNLDRLATELAQLDERIQAASTQVRALITDLRPPQVEPDATLEMYLQQLVDVHLKQGGPPVEYEFDAAAEAFRLSEQQTVGLARVVQEALLNVRKHAQATTVNLNVGIDEHNFAIVIADDGRGFNVAEIKDRPVDRGGAGLANLQLRTEACGGQLTIDSDPVRRGTTIIIILPR